MNALRLVALCTAACLLLGCTASARPGLTTANDDAFIPKRLRLSLGSEPGSLVATWATDGDTLPMQICVQWKLERGASTTWGGPRTGLVKALRADDPSEGAECAPALGAASVAFREPGTGTVTQVVHSLALKGLAPLALLQYRVGAVAYGAEPTAPRWSRWVPAVAPGGREGVGSSSGDGSSDADGGNARVTAKQFSPNPATASRPTQLLVFGDLGLYNAPARPEMIAEAQRGLAAGTPFDVALHVGDLAYDLQSANGSRGDRFLAAIEPLAASVPYMVAPGNHEAGAHNFSHYRALFRMPGHAATENLHYSFDVGLAHIVVYNTEVFFWPKCFRQVHMRAMVEWMERDLAAAAARRAERPWIIVVGHRPMYCAQPAAATAGQCKMENEASRRGLPSVCPHNNPMACRPLPGNDSFPVEQLFRRYGVDLAVYGHVHDYERYNPVYDYQVPIAAAGGGGALGAIGAVSTSEPGTVLLPPGTTMHVTAGGAGNSEMRRGDCNPPQGPCWPGASWCVFQSGYRPVGCQSADHGYARVTIANTTHLHWVQQSHTFDRVVDDWWLVAEHHHMRV